jgi:Flp pilus assembly protein TadB
MECTTYQPDFYLLAIIFMGITQLFILYRVSQYERALKRFKKKVKGAVYGVGRGKTQG